MKAFITLTKLSLRNLRTNTLRTLLTLLGIIISVMAIMLIVALGENVKQFIVGEVESFGTDYVQIETKVPQAGAISRDNIGGRVGTKITTLTREDAKALENLPNVRAVDTGIVAQERIATQQETLTALIFGVSENYLLTDAQAELAAGAFFSERDVMRKGRVVVLGSEAKNELFGAQEAVGQSVKISGQTYRVVGVLKERGAAGFFSFDDVVWAPVSTAQKTLLGVDHIDWITAKVFDERFLQQTADDITEIMRVRHDITDPADDDFAVATPELLIGQIGTIFSVVNWLLVFLASISLIVGGVGIMNVMLVAVEERVSEIGLRKSVGARRSDIVKQFLIEAVVIALFGAVIGIILGFGLLFVGFFAAEQFGFSLAEVIPLSAPLLALGFSFVAGILFGLYPAKKASRVIPLEALRGA